MPYAELRPVEGADNRPTFEVWTEPWEADPFTGPSDRNWDAFSAAEDGATYYWRGGPDILASLAADVAAGRASAASAFADKRVGWWIEQQFESHPDLFGEDDDGNELSPEEWCLRFLEAIREGSIKIDTSDGAHAYYYFEWTNYLADAAHALELPAWACCDSFEGGGPGSSYQGFCISLDPGRTLLELEAWLDDRSRKAV